MRAVSPAGADDCAVYGIRPGAGRKQASSRLKSNTRLMNYLPSRHSVSTKTARPSAAFSMELRAISIGYRTRAELAPTEKYFYTGAKRKEYS